MLSLQAVETLKRAPAHAVLVIEGISGETAEQPHNDSPLSLNGEQENVFEVELMKGIGGLGMSLVGGTDYGEDYGGMLLICF